VATIVSGELESEHGVGQCRCHRLGNRGSLERIKKVRRLHHARQTTVSARASIRNDCPGSTKEPSCAKDILSTQQQLRETDQQVRLWILWY
jgi:hypothetical protein